MAWVRIESAVSRHRKFQHAGPAASWLWLCGLAYCQEGLTDGFIPAEALPYLGVPAPSKLACKLVLAGLWEACDNGGWQVHDYLRHNKPAAEVQRIIHERKEGGKLGGRPHKPSEKPNKVIDNETLEANLTENPDLICSAQIGSNLPRSATKTAEPSNGSTPHVASAASVLEFPTIGQGPSAWDLTSEQVSAWANAYPGIDVLAECRHAKAWVDAQPERRKTAHGMPRFLVNWLNRSVERGGARGAESALIEHPRSRTVGNAEALRTFVASFKEDS